MRAFVSTAGDVLVTPDPTAPVPEGWTEAEVPDGIALDALVWTGTALVDRAGVTTWYVDPHGTRRAFRGDPAWVAFAGAWGDPAPDTPQTLVAYAEARCDAIESSGWGWKGKTVRTDPASQQRLATERLAVLTQDRQDGDPWVFAEGPQALSNADLSVIASGVRNWVKDLIGKREAIKVQILANKPKVTTRAEVDAAFAGA